jgi:hypothetical protein
MNKPCLSILVLALVLCGCVGVSGDVATYQYSTLAQVNAKVRANNSNPNDMFNQWYYAGSDDKYDYIYEFKRGMSITPNGNFHYYKLDRGQFNPEGSRYPFKPNTNTNTPIETW